VSVATTITSSSPQILPPLTSILSAAQALALVFKNQPYAIIGSTSILLLGSTTVQDYNIDILIPRGQTSHFRSLLRKDSKNFTVAPRTLHTTYKSNPPVAIELLTPPFLWEEKYDQDTPVNWRDGVRVLDPIRILDGKCKSIWQWSDEGKRNVDADHILWLLEWTIREGRVVRREEVKNINVSFVMEFIRWKIVGEGF
jgi:hypothetical protein